MAQVATLYIYKKNTKIFPHLCFCLTLRRPPLFFIFLLLIFVSVELSRLLLHFFRTSGDSMSSAGGATNSASGSPIKGGTITTRRRVADPPTSEFDINNNSPFCTSDDEEADNPSDYIPSTSSSSCGSHNYLHHHPVPVIGYLLLRKKLIFSWVPDTWFLWIDDTCNWTVKMVHSLGSGRSMGRKIFGVLLLMAVVSFFIKVSLLSRHVEVNGNLKKENGLLILQTFKDDWASAQRLVAETHVEADNTEEYSMPKRVLERLSVSVIPLIRRFFSYEFIFFVGGGTDQTLNNNIFPVFLAGYFFMTISLLVGCFMFFLMAFP